MKCFLYNKNGLKNPDKRVFLWILNITNKKIAAFFLSSTGSFFEDEAKPGLGVPQTSKIILKNVFCLQN